MPSFSTVKYQTDKGTIVRLRAGEAAVTLAGNAEPAGALTDGRIYAYASRPGNRRGGQLNARGLRLERFLGVGVARKRFTTFVPVFTPAALNAFTDGAALTINGEEYTIKDRIQEA